MKKTLIVLTLLLLSVSGFSQNHRPWYESPNSNNLFFDAVGISHTFGRIGGGLAFKKERFITGVEYGRYDYYDNTLDIAKVSLTYIFSPDKIVSFLGGCGYNITIHESVIWTQKKLSLEFGAIRNFKKQEFR